MNAMNGTALLVLDVQNDLVDPKGKIGAGGLAKIVADRNILSNLKALIAKVREKRWPVVYVGLGYREDYQDVLSVAPGSPRRAKTRWPYWAGGVVNSIRTWRRSPVIWCSASSA